MSEKISTTRKTEPSSTSKNVVGTGTQQLTQQQITTYSYGVAGVLATLFVLLHLFVPRFAQTSSYHDFADKRKMIGIPFFFNVLSNLPFCFIGFQGMKFLSNREMSKNLDEIERKLFNVFFVCVFFGGIGSGLYHLFPNNFTLFFDRLPLTAASLSLLAAIISDRVSKPLGNYLLFPLLAFGIGSAVYWEFSEMIGYGDIRSYAFANFLPAILIPLILLKFPTKNSAGNKFLWNLILFFGIARFGEMFDGIIYTLTLHFISGHVIKHLALSVGVYNVLEYLKNRKNKTQ